jgi:heme-degrading monooxygenase HmoA
MRHIRQATYTITNGEFSELAQEAKRDLLPKFQQQPGFIKYGVADIGDRKFASVSLWETRQQAEAAVPMAAEWVREHMADRVKLETSYVGDFAFFAGALATSAA